MGRPGGLWPYTWHIRECSAKVRARYATVPARYAKVRARYAKARARYAKRRARYDVIPPNCPPVMLSTWPVM